MSRAAPASRNFIIPGNAVLEHPEKVRFTYDEQISRDVSILGNEAINPSRLDRALLEVMFEHYGFSRHVNGPDRLDEGDARTRIISNMSDQEVELLLRRIESVKIKYGRAQSEVDAQELIDHDVDMLLKEAASIFDKKPLQPASAQPAAVAA